MLTTWVGNADSQLEWIEAQWPEASARGLFSMRTGGFSSGQYTSLNMGLAGGDAPQNVVSNRQLVAEQLGGSLSDWVVARQVHGNHVAVVTEADKGRGAFELTTGLEDTDGLITNTPGITLAVLAADCVPVLFFDGVRKVIGTAHSGWRGTIAHISSRVIAQMGASFGTDPEDVHVWLGPSIRRCCYEVDEHVAAHVRKEFGNRFLTKRPRRLQKYLLGLQDCIRQDLQDAGVPAQQIFDTGLCTSCRTSHLYSHRSEDGKTGRSLGAIRLL